MSDHTTSATSHAVPPVIERDFPAEVVDQLAPRIRLLKDEMAKVIVGQDDVIMAALYALLSRGHCLLVGVPGLAKTLLVQTLAHCLELGFCRIQFTPDLMPSDVTGTDIVQDDPASGQRRLAFMPGPIFANIVLADEINRTPPKTQSALLEAMQEHRVTVQGRTYDLAPPFFVFATQNPIELEGTYPLPEAQLDRFLFEIVLEHLPAAEEVEVVKRTTAIQSPVFSHALTGPDLVGFQQLVRRVPAADPVVRYAVDLVRRTRPGEEGAPDFIRKWVLYGASVRAAQGLILAGKARALIQGRYHVSYDDVRALAHPVLRHRVLLNFHAQSERVTTGQVIDRLLEQVAPPRSALP